MPAEGYDRINEVESVRISLASPEEIRTWSYGEVKKPETINYRTYRPERDGLFCERIFGPERDWECSCGKYRGMKHKGIVCDRCGVKVTHSKVRRKRMGHINLSAPVLHIWFFKSMPCRIGNLLDIKASELNRIVYFQNFIVTDPKDTPLKYKQMLTEDEYRQASADYGERSFEAVMGAEAIRKLLRDLDLEQLCTELRMELKEAGSKARRNQIVKQLSEADALRKSKNKPEWLVLDVIPVIPPDLRPLILLESGNFASSDLNDLYRRIINRNNRLKKMIQLNAPEVIIRNEKRMLQQAVDSLFDNNRCKRPVLGSSNRPLKSLTDMIKGKQGRFRENLLGKRVDYSARSVIVVGPELKLHQCGLPKKIAKELYQPFIIRELKTRGIADSVKAAKKELQNETDRVWDVLEDVIKGHPVLLNRAPTLHRMGVQAFEPVLVEGNAIQLHPLVCRGFNADFDGDAMAVHLPLSVEAQVEAKTMMMASHNVFSPQDGSPLISPSQEIVLGCYYLSLEPRDGEKKRAHEFADEKEVLAAYENGKLKLHDRVSVRTQREEIVEKQGGFIMPLEGRRLNTTVGRVLFNEIVPEGMPFYNCPLDGSELGRIIDDCHHRIGRQGMIEMIDDMKDIGFRNATRSGASMAMRDLCSAPDKQKILKKTQKNVDKISEHYRQGAITDVERKQRVIDEWNSATEAVSKEVTNALENDMRDGKPYNNPVNMMLASGARGKGQQISQLAGIRGLMAKPGGEIIETPIRANFREGLSVLEYFSSTHGARKGLADTALKTADSGYLTRRLADVAQNVIISEDDCGTANGITKEPVIRGDKIEVPLREIITGRIARDTFIHPITDEIIVQENSLIDENAARGIEDYDDRMKIRVRSPLTCQSSSGICAMCYGMDLSRKKMAELGLAAGIIAAQSIGEPGTQLTMRTFHTGGVAMGTSGEGKIEVARGGKVRFENLKVVKTQDGRNITISREGEIVLYDEKNRDAERHNIPKGAEITVEENEVVKKGELLAQWDVHFTPVISEVDGKVHYEDIIEGKTLRIERDVAHGTTRKVIMEHEGDVHPQILIEGEDGDIKSLEPIPEKAIVEVEEGQTIAAGTRLARCLREVRGTQDITGGLPRVNELFEARKPRNPALMSEIDGEVTEIDRRRGRTVITIVDPQTGYESTHEVPVGKHMRVNKGDLVEAGEPLVEGPLVLQDILRISGQEALHSYMLDEIQTVYRSQNVTIDDKHIEVLISQMARHMKVRSAGDTELIPGMFVDKFQLIQVNRKAEEQGGEPATAEPMLLGITKAALRSDSFISAASFQNTTRVLTQSALASKQDKLTGLKENVILGHLVPAGTGFPEYVKSGYEQVSAPDPLKQLEKGTQ